MSTPWIVAFVLQWLVIAALVAVVLSLLRQVGALSLAVGPGDGAGAPAPREGLDLYDWPVETIVPALGGGEVELGGETGQPTLVVAWAPGCASCEGTDERLAALSDSAAGRDLALVAVIDLPRADAEAEWRTAPVAGVPAVASEDLPREWRPPGTPWAIALSAEGAVAAVGRPTTLEHLEAIATAARHAVLTGAPDSVREHEWGASVPYWEGELALHFDQGREGRP